MFDFRYHIISLVAVFLALGIGTLFGIMVVEEGVVSEQEKALISRIERDFDKLRRENSEAAESLKEAEDFQKAIIPLTVADKLLNQNVALIVTTSLNEEAKNSLVKVLTLSGANIASTTVISADLGLKDNDNTGTINTLLGTSDLTGNNLKSKLLSEIGRQIATQENPDLMYQLRDLGVFKSEGTYDTPVQLVVVVGGSNKAKSTDWVDVPLITSIKDYNITIAGVETSSVKKSYMITYQELGISTVDNIDKSAGLVSLIYALGGVAGDYGEKPTAEQLLPVL